jgi:pimeloyl-ACP methyl ester carboxylesterase
MKISDHLEDMRAVLAACGLRRFVLGGWSMAVQLSLEYYHHHPEDVRALVLLNGPYERALSGFFSLPGAERLALAVLRAGSRAGHVLNPLSKKTLGAPGLSKVLFRAGIFAGNPAFFERVLAEFCQLDWSLYFTMVGHLHAHSAAAHLAEVRVPTLITTGTRDVLTPVRVAEQMHRAIHGSELFVVPKATHYIVAEYPDVLCDRIARFFAKLEGGAPRVAAKEDVRVDGES